MSISQTMYLPVCTCIDVRVRQRTRHLRHLFRTLLPPHHASCPQDETVFGLLHAANFLDAPLLLRR